METKIFETYKYMRIDEEINHLEFPTTNETHYLEAHDSSLSYIIKNYLKHNL